MLIRFTGICASESLAASRGPCNSDGARVWRPHQLTRIRPLRIHPSDGPKAVIFRLHQIVQLKILDGDIPIVRRNHRTLDETRRGSIFNIQLFGRHVRSGVGRKIAICMNAISASRAQSSLRPFVALADKRRAESLAVRWCRFLRQGHKVDRPMKRTIQHEDTQTVYGRVQGQGRA